MKPFILKANSSEEIQEIANPFINKGFKTLSQDDVHIVLKKRNFGSIIIHIIFLFFILFGSPSYLAMFFGNNPFFNSVFLSNIFINSYYFIFVGGYCIYFIYHLFKKTIVVLITTETLDTEGNPLEFNILEDIDFDN
ncbi:MAG: hypothetical protein LBM96_08155 [Methanobrevibacter sp.]|jgi:hypothetical protein|nr:hypothetical protein [Candidatus Methanoflexus mossambicus]